MVQSEAINKEKIGRKEIFRGSRVLLRMFGKYRKEVYVFIVLGVLSSLGNASVPYLLGAFVDALSDPSTVRVVFGFVLPLYVVILIIWACVQIALTFIDRHISRESDGLALRIWADYIILGLKHLIYLPLSFHKQKKIGDVFNKIIMTADNIERITSSIVIQLSPQILSIFIAIGITFYINPTLGLILVFSLFAFILVYIKNASSLADMQKDMYKRTSRAWGDSYDFVINTRRIKEAVAEDLVIEKMDNSFKDSVAGGWSEVIRIWGNLHFYQKGIIFLAQLTVFIYSIYAILGGWMSIGELLAVNGYVAMVFGPFTVIGHTWQDVQNGIVNINETEKILDMPKEDYFPKEALSQDEIKGEVTFENVYFNYENNTDRPVLKDVSFKVNPGETVAIVGESGVGKTTLVDLLLGFHFATSGRVLIDGCDIRRFNLEFLRRNIAIVSQDIVLFNDTIKENISFGRSDTEFNDEKLEEAVRLADADKFIEEFPDKWEQLVGERGIKLSGGQKQKVAIARAVLADPKILILDEPTSALDARSEYKMQRSLEQIMKDKTTFIIAHRFSTVRNADKIIVLKEGTIVQIGHHNDLISQEGEYKHLYDLQIGLNDQ
ncbi:MAG: ABC transporter ATP-binding protein [Patescibacteria group bacterium]